VGQHHPAVRLARWYERSMGRWADAHFCVSRALQAELRQHWSLHDVTVLYDRPAEVFAPTPAPGRADLFRCLRDKLAFPAAEDCSNAPDRPVLIVSSTSWTADEDFSLLLDAVSHCDALIRRHGEELPGQPFPSLLILITGKGPLREFYEERIAR